MANPWFRMYNDFIFDERIEFVAFEDQRHFVFVLCLKNLGLLDKEYPQTGMLDRVVARRLGLSGEAFDKAKDRLMAVGLIDEDWQPVAWNKRQFISDSDPSHAERQRRYRERQKAKRHGDVTSDVTVTLLDTDTDTDKDLKDLSAVADDTPTQKSNSATPTPEAKPSEAFMRFWNVWPNTSRKADRKKCWDKWRAKKYDTIADRIVGHVEFCKRANDQWKSGYEPAPLTYINGERWNDGVVPERAEQKRGLVL